jgi:hypothetical protein
MKTINKQSHIPYYYQLADILRATIHESVPSENERVYKYQISRARPRQISTGSIMKL